MFLNSKEDIFSVCLKSRRVMLFYAEFNFCVKFFVFRLFSVKSNIRKLFANPGAVSNIELVKTPEKN
jgi:hypothetical protein